jgi:hypothetical protein
MTELVRGAMFGLAWSIMTAAIGCGSADSEGGGRAGDCALDAPPTTTISCVDSFTPGEAAGFGGDDFPAIVFGEPKGGGSHQGSTDVLSLGKGGSIVLGFGGTIIVDGEGDDFVVFENAFFANDDATKPFKELGEVSVSDDAATWTTFPCATATYPFVGCAGWNPVYANPDSGITSTDADAGGDRFDLATIGVASARFIRIRDVSGSGAEPTAGFDLDATAILRAASAQ